MMIWRVQHDCRDWHGPLQSCRGGGWDETWPDYGSSLETPCNPESGLSHVKIASHYVFGTTTEQFPRWWSNRFNYETERWEVLQNTFEGDWYAFLFDVPEESAHVGTNQVIFDSYAARLVLQTQVAFPA